MSAIAIRIALAVALVATAVLPASAAESGQFALGFTTTSAPVGGRYWLTEKVGIDIGLGFEPRDDNDKKDFAVSLGAPIELVDAGRARFNLRPGFHFASIDQGTESDTIMHFLAQFEFEVFMVENFSVRASHGAAVRVYDPAAGGDSSVDLMTTGGNLTSVGFFFYFD